MADPISLTASIIAVSTLAVKIIKISKQISRASIQLLQLENELNDLQASTKQMEAICQEPWQDSQQLHLQRAQRLLDDIKESLEKLDELFKKKILAVPQKVRRAAWPLVEGKINRHRQKIRECKENLLELFNLINTSTTRQLGFEIAQLTVEVQSVQRAQSDNHGVILSRLSNIDNALQISLLPEHIIQAVQHIQCGIDRLVDGFSNNGRNTNNLLAQPEQFEPIPDTAEAPAHANSLDIIASGTSSSRVGSTTGSNKDRELRPQKVISCILEGRERVCPPLCPCPCHCSQVSMANLELVEKFVGQLLVGFSVHSWMRPRCTLPSCKRGGRTVLQLRYRFPTWLLAYSITLFGSLGNQRPELVLRMPRVRSCKDSVFEAVAHGRVEVLRSLFSSGDASILDVEDAGGHTLLHRALLSRDISTIPFLLDQGADLEVPNQKKNSCCDIFWRLVLSNWLAPDDYEPLVPRFSDTSYIDNGCFSVVHKIVFKECNLDLHDYLIEHPHLVDQRDAYGRTPLHWAAARGDFKAVSTLLDHGADANALERGGWGPLHNSILTERPDISRRLLEAGADPNIPSKIWADRPLHITCHGPNFGCHIPVLLEYGAEAFHSSTMRDSPLQFAALRNFADTVEALMKATPPEKHTRAVVSAIESRAEHSLLRLLECGADCQGVDSGGRTVLHYAAIHANTPILRVLVSFREALPSSRLVDNVGYSPSFYAEKRDNKDFSLHQWYLLTGSGDNFDRVIEVESKDTSVLTHID